MYLYDGRRHGLDGIVQGDARVGVGPGIKDYAVGLEAYVVDALYEVALVVALEVGELHVGVALAQLGEVVFEGAVAVDVGLTAAQQVEVGAIDDFYSFHS